jgi:hypothetical protein
MAMKPLTRTSSDTVTNQPHYPFLAKAFTTHQTAKAEPCRGARAVVGGGQIARPVVVAAADPLPWIRVLLVVQLRRMVRHVEVSTTSAFLA